MKKIKRKNGAIKEGFSPLTIVMAVILGLYCLVLAIWLVWALLTSFKNPNDFLGNKYGLPNPWYFDIINDNLQQELCLIYEHIMSQSKKGLILGTHAIASELSEITTGREDANFADTNGKYKFFTCSSETLKCNHYAFNSSSILIAGNGEFNVKHFSGKFNAYQRTYVLTPKQEHYGLLYLACLYQIKSFKSSSAGSIVKFITKGDIDNIPVFIPDDGNYLIQMNKLLDLQEMRLRENEKLLALRDFLLPLLMNGQATIAE